MDEVEVISLGRCNSETRKGSYELMLTINNDSTYHSAEMSDTTANRCIIQGMIDAVKKLISPSSITLISATKIGLRKCQLRKKGVNNDLILQLIEYLETGNHAFKFEVIEGKIDNLKDKVRSATGFSKKNAPESVKKEIDEYSHSRFHTPEMAMKNWHVYVLPPIDFGWNMLLTVEDALSIIAKDEEESDMAEYGWDLSYTKSQFNKDWDSAVSLAKKYGMSSEIRGEPSVFWLPGNISFEYGFVFKEENNGTTYVVSPVGLSWLDSISMVSSYSNPQGLDGSPKQIRWVERIIRDALDSYTLAAERVPEMKSTFSELTQRLEKMKDCGWIIANRNKIMVRLIKKADGWVIEQSTPIASNPLFREV